MRLASVLATKLHYTGYVPVEEWTSNYTGLKKQRYLNAAQSLATIPLSRRDNYITAFVKSEKVQDGAKDPRVIQFRSPRYSCAIAGYLKGMEHSLYSLRGDGKFLPRGKLIAKGCTPLSRGHHIRKAWESMRNPVQLALDCSRFDAHVTTDTLRVEHAVYEQVIKDPYFTQIIRWQAINNGRAYDRATGQYFAYKAHGKRMSGDMNTALGNCVLMLLFLVDAMRQLKVPVSKYRIFDDGDDCALFVEEEYAQTVVANITEVFRQYGQELKVDAVERVFERVTLCGCRPILTDQGWMMLLDPKRLLGKMSCVRAGGANPKHYFAIGECTAYTYPGIPIVEDCARFLMRTGKPGARPTNAYEYDRMLADKVRKQVTKYTGSLELGLLKSWDITPEEIDHYRRWYSKRPALQSKAPYTWFDTTYLVGGKDVAAISTSYHNTTENAKQEETKHESKKEEPTTTNRKSCRGARGCRIIGGISRRPHARLPRSLANRNRHCGRKDGVVRLHPRTNRNEHSRQSGQGLCLVPRQERSPGVRRVRAHDQCHSVYHRARFRDY